MTFAALVSFIVTLCIVGLIAWLLLLLVNEIPLEPIQKVARVFVFIFVILYLLAVLTGSAPLLFVSSEVVMLAYFLHELASVCATAISIECILTWYGDA